MTGILSASQPNWIACVLERVNEDPPRPWQKHHLATQSHADFGERTWVCKRICYRYDSAKPSTKLPRSEIFQLFGNHVLSGYPHISYIYIYTVYQHISSMISGCFSVLSFLFWVHRIAIPSMATWYLRPQVKPPQCLALAITDLTDLS